MEEEEAEEEEEEGEEEDSSVAKMRRLQLHPQLNPAKADQLQSLLLHTRVMHFLLFVTPKV
jgi:hypothetical protein